MKAKAIGERKEEGEKKQKKKPVKIRKTNKMCHDIILALQRIVYTLVSASC